MKVLITFGFILLQALVGAQIERKNLNFVSQMVQSDQRLEPTSSSSNSGSSSAESNEIFTENIEIGSKIPKIKFYNGENCTLIPPPTHYELREFYKWTVTHNKTYDSVDEKFCRTIHLVHNLRESFEHNKLFKLGKVTFMRDLNQFSDLTKNEIMNKILMKIVPKISKTSDPLTPLPLPRQSVDWRQEGLVAPVGHQNYCASGWAWATSAVLEGQLRKCKISNDSVSAQSMVDCTRNYNEMCDGGLPYYAMEWVVDEGIIPASKYKYFDGPGYCVASLYKENVLGFVTTPLFHNFYGGNTEYIKRIVSSYGPVAVLLCANDDFMYYSSGIFSLNACCTSVNHAVTIVGYGSDSKFGDYWLIKNSWDTWWGQNGFGKISRGKNMCEIERTVQYAQIKDVRGNVCQITK